MSVVDVTLFVLGIAKFRGNQEGCKRRAKAGKAPIDRNESNKDRYVIFENSGFFDSSGPPS
jgi:hypothetical protein